MSWRAVLTVIPALSLLILPGAAAAEKIHQSTDEQGTIRISNAPSAGKEKGSEEKAEGKAGEVKAQHGVPAPEGPPPGLNPHKSRRPYGPEAEARRKAFEKAHPNLVPGTPTPPGQPEPAPPGAPPSR
jgi:hypothetical protein